MSPAAATSPSLEISLSGGGSNYPVGKDMSGSCIRFEDGMLYTIEGNKSSKVQGFSYVLSRMEQLLGYGHVPEI